MKEFIKDLLPPLVLRGMRTVKRKIRPNNAGDGRSQDLDVYWDAQMAHILETWGNDNVWNEIQFLMEGIEGRVLDIACGTGKTMEVLKRQARLELHGCDISDMLIEQAMKRGLANDRLHVCDATKMPYDSGQFDYSYSIGSFEHFTDDGLAQVIAESARVTKRASFHMVPTSRSGLDEGWMKTYQSFHNCSPEWWRARFARHFQEVSVVGSSWSDDISVGKWFLCRH